MAHPDDRREEVLALLQANGGNVARTAREAGLPEQTIRNWRGLPPTEKGAQKRGSLAEKLEEIVWTAAGILPEKLKTAKASEVATAMGIAVDKMQLLRGEATHITEDVTHARKALHGRLGQLAARNGAGMVSAGSNGGSGDLSDL
jgi:transposase-like protein